MDLAAIPSYPRTRAITLVRQGDLDCLCGLYAVINALKLLTRDDPSIGDFWSEVFAILVGHADEEVGLANALLVGMTPKVLRCVLRRSATELAHLFGIGIEVSTPFRRRLSPGWLEAFTWYGQDHDFAMIVQVLCPHPHWTVVSEADGDALYVLDSLSQTDVTMAVPVPAQVIDATTLTLIRRTS